LSPLEIWHCRIDLEQEIKQIGNSDLRRKLAGVIAKARGEGLSKDDNFPHLVAKPAAVFQRPNIELTAGRVEDVRPSVGHHSDICPLLA